MSDSDDMKYFIEQPERDCVITFGVASGWSSYLNASLPKGYPIEDLVERVTAMIPKAIRLSSPDNNKVSWIKVFRFEDKLMINQ